MNEKAEKKYLRVASNAKLSKKTHTKQKVVAC